MCPMAENRSLDDAHSTASQLFWVAAVAEKQPDPPVRVRVGDQVPRQSRTSRVPEAHNELGERRGRRHPPGAVRAHPAMAEGKVRWPSRPRPVGRERGVRWPLRLCSWFCIFTAAERDPIVHSRHQRESWLSPRTSTCTAPRGAVPRASRGRRRSTAKATSGTHRRKTTTARTQFHPRSWSGATCAPKQSSSLSHTYTNRKAFGRQKRNANWCALVWCLFCH